MDALRHFEFFGKAYIQVEELNALLKQMKKDAREGKKIGWICDDEGQRISAYIALNKVLVAANAEEVKKRCAERLARIQKEREDKERMQEITRKATEVAWVALTNSVEIDEPIDELRGSWILYKKGDDGPHDFWYFREWDNGKPVIGKGGGMIFAYEGMARKTAERLGKGWVVIDVSQEACRNAERLMAAMFRDDGDGGEADEAEIDNE